MAPDSDGGAQAQEASFAVGKDFLVLIPLLGTGLAMTYDVGFFSGFNIQYFTFFTLSEHIVFALEVLPTALLGAFGLGLIIYFVRRRGTSSDARGIFAFIGGGALTSLICAVVFIHFGASVATSIGLSIGSVFLLFTAILPSLMGRLLSGCASAVIAAYFIGHATADKYLYPNAGPLKILGRLSTSITTTIETKSDGAVEARLLRSGDRGVLFYNEKTKQVTLLRWDEIKQINTAEAP